MKISNILLTNMLKRRGAPCTALVGSLHRPVRIRAFISEYVNYYGRRSLSRYERTVTLMGVILPGDKIMYTPYEPFWDTDDIIRIIYHGKQYEVVFDTIQYIGESPMYVWGIMRPINRVKRDDYDDLDSDVDDGDAENEAEEGDDGDA